MLVSDMVTLDELRQIKRKHSAKLLRQEGVCGVDIDLKKSGEAVLVVHLESRDPELRKVLPKELDGVPVEYMYTGPIRKQAKRKATTRLANAASK